MVQLKLDSVMKTISFHLGHFSFFFFTPQVMWLYGIRLHIYIPEATQ